MYVSKLKELGVLSFLGAHLRLSSLSDMHLLNSKGVRLDSNLQWQQAAAAHPRLTP